MRILRIVFLAAVIILPGLATAQVAPQAPHPMEDMPFAWALLAHCSGGFPPPLAPGGPHPGGSEGPPPFGPPHGQVPGLGLGAWWKDAEIARKLNLSEAQVTRIEQTILEHRLRLVDLRADLEKQEISLQPLLDAERPEVAKVAAQIDLITTARGRLEKERTLSLLAIRRELSTDQWKQLQALQRACAQRGRVGPPAGTQSGPGPTPGRQASPPPSR